jgi:hypothetical protein
VEDDRNRESSLLAQCKPSSTTCSSILRAPWIDSNNEVSSLGASLQVRGVHCTTSISSSPLRSRRRRSSSASSSSIDSIHSNARFGNYCRVGAIVGSSLLLQARLIVALCRSFTSTKTHLPGTHTWHSPKHTWNTHLGLDTPLFRKVKLGFLIGIGCGGVWSSGS